MDQELKKHLENKANWVRRTVLDMSVKAHSGHVTTAFSQCEMTVALYYGGLLKVDPLNPHWDDRDRFILSKGQGGLGLYPILADLGFFPSDELDKFCQGGILGVHAENAIPGIEVLTGSLGHGLPIATGMCHAARLDNKEHFVFCMLGDGELFEGSNWEAMFTAAHQQYGHLICIVDRNGQATIGKTDEIELASDGPRIEPLADKFEAFGFDVYECDGHDFESIFDIFKQMAPDFHPKTWRDRSLTAAPICIISHTLKGKGAKLMEDARLWHYRTPSGEDLEAVRKDLDYVLNSQEPVMRKKI